MIDWFIVVLSSYPFRVAWLIFISGLVLYGIASGKAGRIISAVICGVWVLVYAPLSASILMTHGAKIFSSPPSVALLGSFLIFTMVALAALLKELGLEYAGDKTRVTSFWDSLYFAIITWTTVGYGDIVPARKRARLGAAYAALLGYFTMAALLAAVLNAMAQG